MKSFSLIETIFAVTIFALLAAGIFETLTLGVKTLGRSQIEDGAIALATRKTEFIRNLPYNQIGTIGGIPSGNLPQTETETIGSIAYTLNTFIQYVDDPADGIGGADANGISADYKRARVEVLRPPINPIVFISNFSPPGIETVSGGGTLKITALDALGAPVSLAAVTIRNGSSTPPIDITASASSEGEIIFPGAAATANYEIIVTKQGYSEARTYPVSAQNINPSPGFLTVLEAQTVQAGFTIDRLATLTINASSTTKSVADIAFEVRGLKTIGSDADAAPIYKYDQIINTDAQGNIVIPNIEWDIYAIIIRTAGYVIVSSNPAEPVAVDPASNTSVLLMIQ